MRNADGSPNTAHTTNLVMSLRRGCPIFSPLPPRWHKPNPAEPLAARMRPRSLDEVAGQQHILAPGQAAAPRDRVGPLHLADFLRPAGHRQDDARQRDRPHDRIALRVAQRGGVERRGDPRQDRPGAHLARAARETTILFIDEIHRFNKAQQDVLLPHIERGTVRFIGATTHNPYFHVNSPLVSRSQIFQLEPVPVEDVIRRDPTRARR
jgi:putative ATPase